MCSSDLVQLKRRRDLIPNLVECVKGYAKHEQSTLENVVKLRDAAMNASDPADVAKAESDLSRGLKSLFALGESYPELKAGANFAKLQDSLEKIEDDLQNARRYYNATARDLNMAVNLYAPLTLIRRFAAALPANETGAIVNMLDARVLNLTPRFTTYTLSKRSEERR